MGKFIFALLVWRMEGEVFVRKLAMKTSLVLSGLLCFFGAMHKWGDNTKRRDCELVAGRFKGESKVWNSLAFGSADGLHEILYRLEMNAKEPTATFPYVLIQIRRLLGWDKFCARNKKRRFERVGFVLFFPEVMFRRLDQCFLRSVGKILNEGGNTGEFLEKRIGAK